MKVLVLGDAASIFVKQFIEYVLLDKQNKIILLQENNLINEYKDFYLDNCVELQPLNVNAVCNNIYNDIYYLINTE